VSCAATVASEDGGTCHASGGSRTPWLMRRGSPPARGSQQRGARDTVVKARGRPTRDYLGGRGTREPHEEGVWESFLYLRGRVSGDSGGVILDDVEETETFWRRRTRDGWKPIILNATSNKFGLPSARTLKKSL
jgi:hypothetical protein